MEFISQPTAELRFVDEQDVDLDQELVGVFSSFLVGDFPVVRQGDIIQLASHEGELFGLAVVTDYCTTSLGRLFDLGYDRDHWRGLTGDELWDKLSDLFGLETTGPAERWTALRLVRLRAASEAEEPEDAQERIERTLSDLEALEEDIQQNYRDLRECFGACDTSMQLNILRELHAEHLTALRRRREEL